MKPRIDRLRKLAEHLERGRLGHKKFDFTCINADHTGSSIVAGCGTSGCAMGELPIAFPRTWWFTTPTNWGTRVRLRENSADDLNCDVMTFFGLTDLEIEFLFYPSGPIGYNPQFHAVFGKDRLSHKATAKQVAGRIRRFVEDYPKYRLKQAV